MVEFGDSRLPAHFWSKAFIDSRGCWKWTGAHTADGYAHFAIRGKAKRSHRVSYEALVGPIEDNLQIDHLCRVRDCVNPDHLEPVTPSENVRRGLSPLLAALTQLSKTHCPQGHAYTAENTFRHATNGARSCRICKKVYDQKYRLRMRERKATA